MLIVDALRKGNRSFPACLSICQPIGWSFLLALWLTFVIGFYFAPIGKAFAAEPLSQERSVLQLRISWGGGVPTSWSGSLSVDDGRIIDHRSLGVSEDEPGSMWIDQGIEFSDGSLYCRLCLNEERIWKMLFTTLSWDHFRQNDQCESCCNLDSAMTTRNKRKREDDAVDSLCRRTYGLNREAACKLVDRFDLVERPRTLSTVLNEFTLDL